MAPAEAVRNAVVLEEGATLAFEAQAHPRLVALPFPDSLRNQHFLRKRGLGLTTVGIVRPYSVRAPASDFRTPRASRYWGVISNLTCLGINQQISNQYYDEFTPVWGYRRKFLTFHCAETKDVSRDYLSKAHRNITKKGLCTTRFKLVLLINLVCCF